MPTFADKETDRHMAIICSKGALDMAYPGLILANAALSEGVEVDLFFTFWGLDMVNKKKTDHLKFTPVGNPATGMPQMIGGLPGMTAMATRMMRHQIEDLDVPPIHEFLTMIHDAGGRLWGCKMSTDMMDLETEDLIEEVKDIITASDFIEMTEDAQLLFI
ncbi:MAG: DsrE/DsrF/DrsH-like family protein [Acidimicrobiia bacterium]|nr:DsrE/DsrF/DrsH-like family protein [Acidimicrobiia bacterium]